MGECLVRVVPTCYRSAIARQHLEFTERCTLPIYRTQQNRNDTSLSRIMSLQSLSYLYTIAIVGREKVDTDEQQNDRGCIEALIQSLSPVCAKGDQPLVDGDDQTLTLQDAQMFI